jgi:potassium-transporting ATPase KdpC subunit
MLFREIVKAIRVTLILWLITAVIYPVIMLGIGQLIFPFQANGSLIKNEQNVVIGSALIGQSFQKDNYFWSRPSVTNYSGVSGASNLAPSNPVLKTRIQGEIEHLQKANIRVTNDLVYTSGSGLDPHISIEAARNQIKRIAKARNLDTNQLEILINQNIDPRFLGIFGEPGVNVLKLNLALDRL